MSLYAVDAPIRPADTMERLYDDLARFLGTVRSMPARPRRHPWQRAVEVRWTAYLARIGRVEILDDLVLYAWSRRAAVEVVAAHLPYQVQQWERAVHGPAYEMRDLDALIEPAMRRRATLPAVGAAEATAVHKARRTALAWAAERPMLDDFAFETGVMTEFTTRLRDMRAGEETPAHLLIDRGLEVLEIALRRRSNWRDGASDTPVEESR